MILSIVLLLVSNVFMTFAWYGHLKTMGNKPLWIAILVSWSIAFVEYCFQVPANRIGYRAFTLPQLKIIQEVITLIVFSGFTLFFMRTRLTWNFIWAGFCLLGAVFFIFRDKSGP